MDGLRTIAELFLNSQAAANQQVAALAGGHTEVASP